MQLYATRTTVFSANLSRFPHTALSITKLHRTQFAIPSPPLYKIATRLAVLGVVLRATKRYHYKSHSFLTATSSCSRPIVATIKNSFLAAPFIPSSSIVTSALPAFTFSCSSFASSQMPSPLYAITISIYSYLPESNHTSDHIPIVRLSTRTIRLFKALFRQIPLSVSGPSLSIRYTVVIKLKQVKPSYSHQAHYVRQSTIPLQSTIFHYSYHSTSA